MRMIEKINDPTGRNFLKTTVTKDVIVVGAGPAGICAAVVAARLGMKTALITDRPILGGNASSEIRVTINGADSPVWNRYARETGIIEEISLRLVHRSSTGRWRWIYMDDIYFDITTSEPNLEVFLNTTINKVGCESNRLIHSIQGIQLRSERIVGFEGTYFVDASGDGVVGFLAGADYRIGRESKKEFNETLAPDVSDRKTMGATLVFSTCDRGHPVRFKAPQWAIDVSQIPVLLDVRNVSRRFYREPDGTFYGLWWAEYGGDIDSIHDDDEVIWHTRRLVCGLWDYIKNSGKFENVENQEIDWIGYLPGKRESRRLIGHYIATERDFKEQREFSDAIGFCGWPIDIHPPKGYLDMAQSCTFSVLPGITDIPLRILFSRNIENLFFAGRNISCSHVALGTLRVIATTAVMGQAVGTAVAFCIKQDVRPTKLVSKHISDLRELLAKNDQSIIGYRLMHKNDLSRTAKVKASSERKIEITEGDFWYQIDQRYGIIMPVETEKVDRLFLYMKGPKRTEVKADVFGCDKPQNYRLKNKLKTVTVTLNGEGWVMFDLNVKPMGGKKIIFVLDKQEDVFFKVKNTKMVGVLGVTFHQQKNLNFESKFGALPYIPCFKVSPEQKIYSAQNVNDGYIRPYGLPHIYSSDTMKRGHSEWIELELSEISTINTVELIFNSDLNSHRYSMKGMFPEMVRDYEIQVVNGKRAKMVVKECDNILRFRRHSFGLLDAEKVRLIIHSTWGSKYAEVFDFRVFRVQ